MSRTRQVLERAAELLETKGWTQGAFARRVDKEPVTHESPQACSFCLDGALMRAAAELRLRPLDGTYARGSDAVAATLHRNHGHMAYVAWNDEPGRTKEEVVALLRHAAENA